MQVMQVRVLRDQGIGEGICGRPRDRERLARDLDMVREWGDRRLGGRLGPEQGQRRALAGAFLEAGEIDEARMFIAPVMLGGAKAKTALEGIGVAEIAAGSRALAIETERIEDDVLVVARFKEW